MIVFSSSPIGGPKGRALKAWIKERMPELDAELGPMGLDRVRERLNQVTGCNVSADGRVEDGCAVFLAAPQAQHERRTED